MALDHANKANTESAKAIKRAAANLLEIETAVNEEAKARADIQDKTGIVERKGRSVGVAPSEQGSGGLVALMYDDQAFISTFRKCPHGRSGGGQDVGGHLRKGQETCRERGG